MTDDDIAAQVLALAGGETNVRSYDLCFTRLRLVLADFDAVDTAAIEAIPAVVMTFTQGGQFQIVLGSRVRGVYNAIRALLGS